MLARPLTQARVDDLKPRKAVHSFRDDTLKGFGVRVLPSGRKRFFIHTRNDGRRVWKIVGDADTLRLDEARCRASALRAAIRRSGDAPPAVSHPCSVKVVWIPACAGMTEPVLLPSLLAAAQKRG